MNSKTEQDNTINANKSYERCLWPISTTEKYLWDSWLKTLEERKRGYVVVVTGEDGIGKSCFVLNLLGDMAQDKGPCAEDACFFYNRDMVNNYNLSLAFASKVLIVSERHNENRSEKGQCEKELTHIIREAKKQNYLVLLPLSHISTIHRIDMKKNIIDFLVHIDWIVGHGGEKHRADAAVFCKQGYLFSMPTTDATQSSKENYERWKDRWWD